MSEPNECPRLIEVHRLWEGEIDTRRAGEVRQHLAHCSCCRVEYENWDRVSDLLARGDPAAPLVPERQRLMKVKLLAECAASLEAAGDEARQRSAVRPGAWRWRMPVRIALALAPLALAALVLAYAYHGVPPGEPRSTMVGSALPAPMSARKLETAPRWPTVARAPDASKPSARPRPKVSPRAVKRPHRAVRSRHIEMAGGWLGPRIRLRSVFPRIRVVGRRRGPAEVSPMSVILGLGGEKRVRSGPRPLPPSPDFRGGGTKERRSLSFPLPQDWGRGPGGGGRLADHIRIPKLTPTGASPGTGLPAPQPIDRIVIQVDGPPTSPPIHARSVTHITVIAAGNLQAPGAQLTVVKSRREESLP